MSANKKGPIVDPGTCRCCGVSKKCRLLNFEYEWLGRREVYSEMFVDCFGLVLSNLEGEESERLICATCVVRLRDASAFRQQVLQCEQRLLNATVHIHEVGEDNRIKLEVQVKQEEAIEEPLKEITDDDATVIMKPMASPRPDDHHDSDDHHSDDAGDDDMDTTGETTTVSVEIKREFTPVLEKEKVLKSTRATRNVKRSQRLRRRAVDSASTMKLNTTLKSDMLDKLQRMKDKLNNKIKKDPAPKPQKPENQNHEPKYRRPPIQDKEMNTLRNTLTIIENSYVTPFIALFSDYHCVYCREMFLEPDKLREHTLEHDPRTYQEFLTTRKMSLVDIVRIDCRLCQAQIDDIDTFKEHITSVHNKVIYKDVDTEFIKFKLKMGKLSCLECDKSFNFFQALRKHMAEHFGTFICDVCGAHYFEERHLIFHKKSHITDRCIEMFPCPDCEKTFRSKNSRNFHVARIHRNEAAYPCNKCDEIFISYHMRYRHKMTVHGEKREFPCEGCDKVYDCRKTLREHYQRTHLQLLRHECTLCDKKFYLPSALRDHMTSHTGERLYRCDYCGKNYPRKKALKVHMQSHNTEKKFKCTLCPSAYTQANNFKNHMKSKHPLQPEFQEGYQ